MSERVFVSMHPGRLASHIRGAHSRVVYAAPGMSLEVATELIRAVERLGINRVAVVTDVDPEVCRLGYGMIEAVQQVAASGIPIRQATGLRIGLLLCDDEGWLFSPTPLLVEPEGHADETPNAVAIEVSQVERLFEKVCPGSSVPRSKHGATGESAEPVDPLKAEIGIDLVPTAQIQKTEESLRENPPLKFDLARKVRVFNAFIEFAEFSFEGGSIDRRRIDLPEKIARLVKDEKIQDRLRTQFALLGDASKIAKKAKEINGKVSEIRETYLKNIGPQYGRVILRARKTAFHDEVQQLRREIAKYETEVRGHLALELSASRAKLVKELVPNIRKSPPRELQGQIQGDKPTKEETEAYLAIQLDRVFPTADNLIEKMRLDVQFKGVTYETLQSAEFQEAVRRAFPLVNWTKPFHEFDASQGKPAQQPKPQSDSLLG